MTKEPIDHNPTTCHVCQRRANGVGIEGVHHKDPIRWLCGECALLAQAIRDAKRLDPYEIKALAGGVEAVGEYLGDLGKTDLSEFDELERDMLVKAAVLGFGRRLRSLIRSQEAPF